MGEPLGTQVPALDIVSVVQRLLDIFNGGKETVTGPHTDLFSAWNDFYLSYAIVSITVCLILLVGIAYAIFRAHQVHTRVHHAKEAASHARHLTERADLLPGEVKWRQVLAHATSGNSQEWRLAILEADIILDELVFDKFGYLGDTLGDRLKKVPRGDFQTIDQAWEAHRIRNAIAHEGSDFKISEGDMRHSINLYRQVFEEFHYI